MDVIEKNNKKNIICNDLYLFFFIISFTFYNVIAILAFILLALPKNWLGGMDGYFYGLMIKSYLHTFKFTSLDMESPLLYSPYLFYLLGMIGRITHISDLGQLQIIGFILALGSFPLIIYFFLRPYMSPLRVLISIFVIFLFSLNSSAYETVWQKSHEILGILSIPAIFVYIQNISNEKFTNKRHRIISGLLAGFLFGVYPAFEILAIISAGIIILGIFIFNNRESIKRKFKYIIDPYFVIPCILFSFPYIIYTFYIFFSNKKEVGFVSTVMESELRFNFLHLNYLSIPYFLTISLLPYFIWKSISEKSNNIINMFFIMIVLLGFLFYSFSVIGYYNKIYITAPFKFYFPISIIGGLMIAYLPFNQKIYEMINIKTSYKFKVFFIGFLSFFLSTFLFYKIYNLKELKNGIYLSEARNKNLNELIKFIEKVKKNKPLNHYIASGEARFLDYYVKGIFVNRIMFNESYASSYEDIDGRAERLKESILKGENYFYNDLKTLKIDVLILGDKKNDSYNIDYIHITPGKFYDKYGTEKRLNIPYFFLVKMVEDKYLNYKKLNNFDVYFVN